jgi:T5orf172 domain
MLYFALAPNFGTIKIGCTSRPLRKRLEALNTCSLDRVRLLAWMDGGREDEAALHQQFAACRHRGEWFRPAPALVRFIASEAFLDSPQFHALTLSEPALCSLWADALACHQGLAGAKSFCANVRWYGYGDYGGRGLKDRLCRLVGWEARRQSLRTEFAYDVAYDAISEVLPDCRNCGCG